MAIDGYLTASAIDGHVMAIDGHLMAIDSIRTIDDIRTHTDIRTITQLKWWEILKLTNSNKQREPFRVFWSVHAWVPVIVLVSRSKSDHSALLEPNLINDDTQILFEPIFDMAVHLIISICFVDAESFWGFIRQAFQIGHVGVLITMNAWNRLDTVTVDHGNFYAWYW